MSIELEFLPGQRATLIALVMLPLVFLGALGRRFTPTAPDGTAQVLTWSEWQVMQAARRYDAELQKLRREANTLAELLEQAPDPVRAQLTAERIVSTFSEGEPALQYPRELVVNAALTIQDWSVGLTDHETAASGLEQTITMLEYAADAEE